MHTSNRCASNPGRFNLRRKLGDDPASPRYLRTVRGTGYCLTREVGHRVVDAPR
ncbi:winged helix-turn-helix domain-containing protein [Mycolicibacterium gilvum]|uniref:winged helix-turn-helix domain-containing protein n=1 Tax=Mycolicibacterium gilvum TaxID=1804 RepID=UPI002351CC6A|nr:helix-turn-helix domain-containing protein [Mycolicibacterium gilvum]